MSARFPSLALLALSCAVPVVAADDLPDFEDVEKAVETQLSSAKGNFPNRLLVRSDVELAFKAIAKLGWQVVGEKAIVERFPPDNDAVAKILRAPRNAEFAKKIAGFPNVYDRLDQLARMPYGMRRIREFATTKGGYTMLEYMTTTKGGAELSQQLSRGRNGKGFGKPTGRLYTQSDLLRVLQESYDEATGIESGSVAAPRR